MENNYQTAVNIITSREKFHICLGLERVSKVLEFLGNPQNDFEIIHIAGTNGKGSVSCLLSKILTEAGYKTGLYTSPHIINYTERIKINQKDIPERAFGDLIEAVSKLAQKHDVYLTEFEILTAAAYKYFSDEKAEICVVETGLGGRLDATSAIEKNLLSIITSISLDHTDRLGNTIEEIAFEKAGIIKEGYPTLISPENLGFETVKKHAEEKKSMLLAPQKNVELSFENDVNYTIFDGKKYEFNMLGLWQGENLELVLESVEFLRTSGYLISEEALKTALAKVNWACRMQFIKEHSLLIDGTHNPDGARVLRQSLDFYFPNKKRIWVYGVLTTKDYEKVMQTLFRTEDEVYFYDFDYPSAVKFDELKKHVPQGKWIDDKKLKSLVLDNKGSIIIVAGSFYMIGGIINSDKFFKNIAELDNIY